MLGIGKQVLQKIQNLLVQIDKKKQKKKQKQPTHNKSQIKQNNHNEKIIKSHQKSKTKKIINEEDKQNICSHRVEQLYLNHFVKQKRLLDRNLSNMEYQMKQIKQFKVQNKTSQFLNQKLSLKPIYQRTQQILKKKQKSIEKIKQSVPKKPQQIQEQEVLRLIQQRQRKYPKLTKQQFQKKMLQMQRRNIQRIQRLQRKKLMELQQKSQSFIEKPQIAQANKAWWQKKKLKKNLSNNVIERFSQYDAQKRLKWDRYLEQRKQEQTPFAPRISQTTRQIAKKSLSKKHLYQKFTRSHSCRILNSKRQEPSFIDRREQSTTQRSLSRNILHGKSATTMDNSRNALIDRRFN